MNKKDNKHCVTFNASRKELIMIQKIMKRHKRKTYSDTFRFLIECEHEKILKENDTIVAKRETGNENHGTASTF